MAVRLASTPIYPSLKLLTSPTPSRALDYQIHEVKGMYNRYCLQAISLTIRFFDDYPWPFNWVLPSSPGWSVFGSFFALRMFSLLRRPSSSTLFFIFALTLVFVARLRVGFEMPFFEGEVLGGVDGTPLVAALVELSCWAFKMRSYRLALFSIRSSVIWKVIIESWWSFLVSWITYAAALVTILHSWATFSKSTWALVSLLDWRTSSCWISQDDSLSLGSNSLCRQWETYSGLQH